MEVLSSATSPFKRRKVNSSYKDDDDDDVELVSVISPERSPEISPERDSVESRIADPKADSSTVGTEIPKLVDTKLSEDNKNEPKKTPKKKRLPVSNFDRKNMAAKMPPAEEIEEFFSVAEKYEQKRFLEKNSCRDTHCSSGTRAVEPTATVSVSAYNFDVVKEVPLEGHYQWILLKP